jgi:hypothetical protein
MLPENLAHTYRIIESFEKARHQVVAFLNSVRDGTLCEVKIPECLRSYLEIGDSIPVGVVRNMKGFYKLFQLDAMTEQKRGRIRRQSGNYPIQGSASELMRIILMRLYTSMWREGWIQKGYVKWHVSIHDELLGSFKKGAIHPIHLIAVLQKACCVRPKGHTNYYIGINIGNSWGDCKDDHSELPVYLVDRLVKRWDSGEFNGEVVEEPVPYVRGLREKYITDRIGEVLSDTGQDLSLRVIDCAHAFENFTNYTVKKYLYEGYAPLWSLKRDKSDREEFCAKLASWALDAFGDGVELVFEGGRKITLTSSTAKQTKIVDGRDAPLSFAEMFDGEEIDVGLIPVVSTSEQAAQDSYQDVYWDLGDSPDAFYIDYGSGEESAEASFDELFDSNAGSTFESMLKTNLSQYENVEVAGTRAVVSLARKNSIVKLEALIKRSGLDSDDGIQIWYSVGATIMRGCKVKQENLSQLSDLVVAATETGGSDVRTA